MAVDADRPLRLGLIADIQYADTEDGADFTGEEKRYFRNALKIARSAVDTWNAAGVDAIVNLGDLIDGCNVKLKASDAALRSVLDVLSCSAAPFGRFDLVGNHELYNIKKEYLQHAGLRCVDPAGLTYYSSQLGQSRWDAIFLDSFDISLIGGDESNPSHKKAVDIINTMNPNVLTKGGDWFEGLPVEKHRYVPFNGALSEAQLAWLKERLVAAQTAKRWVLIFTHVPCYVPATKARTIVWNAEEVLKIIHEHADIVMAVFAGHDHDGGYAVDEAGIHHITMNGALTATPGDDCYAILECHDDGWARFCAHGRACVESNTRGKGRNYPELLLAKGATNQPEEDDRYLTTDYEQATNELVTMGFSRDQAQRALQSVGGDLQAAVSILLAQT